MLSIALLIIIVLCILAVFTYAMVALTKKDIFLTRIHISKKNGICLSFKAKEKNESLPSKEPRS